MIHPYITIEWVDSARHDGWVDRQHESSDLVVHSIGLLVHEDDTTVTITTSLTSNEAFAPLTIPKVAIRMLRYHTHEY